MPFSAFDSRCKIDVTLRFLIYYSFLSLIINTRFRFSTTKDQKVFLEAKIPEIFQNSSPVLIFLARTVWSSKNCILSGVQFPANLLQNLYNQIFHLQVLVPQTEVPDPKWICPDRPRRKVPMSRPSQTQSAYVQTVPDGKWICPDYRAFKIFRAFFVRSKTNMSRPSQTETVYVQTFVRSCPDHRALQIKLVRSTPNF